MTDPSAAAHRALQDQFRGEDAPCVNALEVAIRFHEWADANGYEVEITDLREKHVWGDLRVDEPIALLVLEWVGDE